MSLNQVIISGRLGKNPELRTTSSGKSVVGFSLAVDDGYGDKKTTEWIYVEAWEKTAEAVNRLLTQGKRAAVIGRLKTETWESNGEKKSRIKVVAEKVEIIDFPEKEQSDSDIPF